MKQFINALSKNGLEKLFLQMFNDDPNNGGNAGGGDPGSGEGGQGGSGDGDSAGNAGNNEPKLVTMTQEDFDAAIAKRLERAEKKFEKTFKESDEYKAFQKYQDDQKTADQKTQEKLLGMSDLEKSNAELQRQLSDYQNKDALLKEGVDPKFTEFVLFEVNKSVNDDNSFEDALKAFKENESNGMYFGNSNNQQRNNQQGGRRHEGSNGNTGDRADAILQRVGYRNKGKK